LDAATRKQLERGKRVMELMKQKQYQPLSVAEMALTLYAVNEGFVDDVPVEKVVEFETEMHAFARQSHKAALDAINAKPEYSDEVVASLKKIVEAYKKGSGYGGASAPKEETKPAADKPAKPAADKAPADKAPAKK
jgi:F-type H+-transporting ATPase subunit alpha